MERTDKNVLNWNLKFVFCDGIITKKIIFLFKIPEFVDEKFKIGKSLIKKRETIYKLPGGLIEKAIYNDLEVVLKSFSKTNDEREEDFPNEIITFQILESQELLKKSPYIAEYIGFIMYESGPYFGSIVIKFYPLGDLAHYCKQLIGSKSKKSKQNDQGIKSRAINVLVDLAKQIAEGN